MAPPASILVATTERLIRGDDLSREETADVIGTMLSGVADDGEIETWLLAMRAKGETVEELVGAAVAMRAAMTRIDHHHDVLLDTCGTGGSGSGTFNISTAVAIVAAAAGVPVAKHGNRRASSRSGSADVLECLGVAIQSDPDAVSARLNQIGICFCFAAKLHPAMRHVVAIRRKLAVPTLFNLLGPLCNPAAATHQLLGTASPQIQEKIAAALAQLDTRKSFVLHADDGQDEVSLAAPTQCVEVTAGGRVCHRWTPADFGLPTASSDALTAQDPADSARIIREILDGRSGPPRDCVVAGAAAALLLVGHVPDLPAGVAAAAATIDDGGAKEKLQQLVH